MVILMAGTPTRPSDRLGASLLHRAVPARPLLRFPSPHNDHNAGDRTSACRRTIHTPANDDALHLTDYSCRVGRRTARLVSVSRMPRLVAASRSTAACTCLLRYAGWALLRASDGPPGTSYPGRFGDGDARRGEGAVVRDLLRASQAPAARTQRQWVGSKPSIAGSLAAAQSYARSPFAPLPQEIRSRASAGAPVQDMVDAPAAR
jgi:hypothetical protein